MGEENNNSSINLNNIIDDPRIKNVNVKDVTNNPEIKLRKDIKLESKKSFKTVATPVIFTVLGLLLAFGIGYSLVNFTFVQGNVVGAEVVLGPVSVVSKHGYNPAHHLKVGAIIYYNGVNVDDAIYCASSGYKSGKVTKINDKYVYIEGAVKDEMVNINDVDFVISSE